MSLEFNNLLVALVFLLPGFLTSRLISARTPAFGRQTSTFQETLESLLRSVYIHLLIAPFFFTVIWYFFIRNHIFISDHISRYGFQVFYLVWPFETVVLLFGWLLISFLLAVFLGYKYDPLDELFLRLANKKGTKSEDLFYQLRQRGVARQQSGKENDQLWIQARLKNGYTYRGKLDFAGYRHDGMGRELLLADVKFFAYPAQILGQTQDEPKLYDFVLIEFENCESLEVLFGPDAPSKNA